MSHLESIHQNEKTPLQFYLGRNATAAMRESFPKDCEVAWLYTCSSSGCNRSHLLHRAIRHSHARVVLLLLQMGLGLFTGRPSIFFPYGTYHADRFLVDISCEDFMEVSYHSLPQLLTSKLVFARSHPVNADKLVGRTLVDEAF